MCGWVGERVKIRLCASEKQEKMAGPGISGFPTGHVYSRKTVPDVLLRTDPNLSDLLSLQFLVLFPGLLLLFFVVLL